MRASKPATKFSALALSCALAACGGGGDSQLATPPTPPAAPTPALQRVFPSLPALNSPVAMLQAPTDSTRWYVVEQSGVVRRFANDAAVASSSIYADISARGLAIGGERGLLGMAFHPNFPTNPRVYLAYTAFVAGQLMLRLSVFLTSNNGDVFDLGSEQVLLNANKPQDNHNGGHVMFGADGFLYLGIGDGGGGGDVHGVIGNGQDTNTLLGKILRIDVNAAAVPYGIPAGNPFAANARCNITGVGTAPCPEIYAYGLRNPWRFSMDRDTGMLWIGDVGQNAWEEIDRVGSAGVNLGWRCREGAHVFNSACGPAANLVDPVAEYDRSAGQSVTGGYVYRGAAYPSLRGYYVFGDFRSTRVFVLSATTGNTTTGITGGVNTGRAISSFGEGNDRELYAVDYGGSLYRVTAQ